MVLIRPLDGDQAGTAALLLAIADQEDNDFTAHDVKTDTDDGLQFRVPDGLAELYEREVANAGTDATDEAPKPKRGRPRKNTEE